MNRHVVRALIVVLCTSLITFAADKTAPAALEATVDKAMKAYNASDWKAFFADYAQSMSAIATEQTFKALYESSAKPQFGNYVSRTLIAGESSINDEAPLLVYKAKFAKGEAKLSVNFIKEGTAMKIMQVQIAPAK
jgi:hypothetical protein